MPERKNQKVAPSIQIKGARVHNLKNITIEIPRNQLVVVTGVSGSGKSSLAFDTLYAEGQRRYVESLSSYARQFMGRMDKPEVDYINGISPAIAIEQKVNTRNPRSTVGTSTEIYDYLKLLFARIGKTISPVSGQQVLRHTVEDVVAFLQKVQPGSRALLFAPTLLHTGRSLQEEFSILLQKGFSRISVLGTIKKLDELLESENKDELIKLSETLGLSPAEKKISKSPGKKNKKNEIEIITQPKRNEHLFTLIDRFVVDLKDETNLARISDSAQTAFFEGMGELMLQIVRDDGSTENVFFNNRFESDGITFEEPSTQLFSFNNPYGACKKCEGFGSVMGIDEDLVIPDKSLSVYESAIACWRGEKMKEWNDALIRHAYKFDFPIHRPIYELTTDQKEILWTGNSYFKGLKRFFEWLETQTYKIQYRVMLSRYRGRTTCPDCRGTRLRPDANYVKVSGKSITDVVLMPVADCFHFFEKIELSSYDREVVERILIEINNRLRFLCEVGLGYVTLNRLSNTLSGGESQRINLATSLGSSLVGSMYILDEPSIGLHPRDTERLVGVLKSLRDTGNTLIIVEHDEDIMKASDHIIDIGPDAGRLGGEVVFEGSFAAILRSKEGHTGKYLSGKEMIPVPINRRKWSQFISLEGVRENNLKNLSVKFPIGVMTVVTGVSGSGKTSLVKKVLYPALKKIHGGFGEQSGAFDKLGGHYSKITCVEMVDQNPIGKSSRSNPVTYIKAYDEIRSLFAELPMSKSRRYKPAHFSFNVEGGRCEVCEGEGEVTIEMQFMADIHLVCENCGGKRFKQEILDVTFKGKNIADILDLTVDEAIDFFRSSSKSSGNESKLVTKLLPLQEVGLGYVKLGQSSSTLSGGEAQRIKLASFLGKGNKQEHTLFIFDEPTTGLHFHDIRKLLLSFEMLIAQGNTILIIEHNLEVIKCADWVIDIGPEGGDNGGNIVFEGLPEGLANCKSSYTGRFLRDKIN